MYYYLFDSDVPPARKRWQNRFKDKISLVGIEGEYVAPSPARTIDELVQMGVDKGYSTTVAIGTDAFINKVASSLIIHSLKSDRKIVLGAVPTDRMESFFWPWLNFQSDDEIINILRSRHLISIPLGLIQPNKFFVSPIGIHREPDLECEVKTSSYIAHIQTPALRLYPTGKITTEPSVKRSFVGQLINLLSRRSASQYESSFKVVRAEISSADILPISLDHEVIAKTPVIFQVAPRLLHFISHRDILESAEVN